MYEILDGHYTYILYARIHYDINPGIMVTAVTTCRIQRFKIAFAMGPYMVMKSRFENYDGKSSLSGKGTLSCKDLDDYVDMI